MPFFIPKKLQHENEINAVLERQISHDMNGLKGLYTDIFETIENRKISDEIWETGKIHMEVNTMTRIMQKSATLFMLKTSLIPEQKCQDVPKQKCQTRYGQQCNTKL